MLDGALVVDNFAGGGGASTGIEAALGRPIDIAINHSPQAIAMHAANHPNTLHLCENVWQVDPAEVCAGRPVVLAWFSPDCTHFSRAKGGKPRSKKTRALAWVVVRWARAVRPAVIMLENVEEFLTWGPLGADGQPDARRAGRTFKMWVGKLRALGYKVEWRSLVAADFGAPTTRRRLFLIARCDGQPIVWPTPTHGRGRAKPWRTAAEIIDWSIPCPSIFDRKKPLAEATLRRIAAGLRRYVIEHPRPFVIPVRSHGGGGNGERSIDEPLRTVTATKRGEFAVVTPYLTRTDNQSDGRLRGLTDPGEPVKTVTSGGGIALVAPCLLPVTHQGGERVYPVDEPTRTITAANRGEIALAAATLVQTGYGEREGQSPRVPGVEKPLGTVVPGGKHAVVAAFLAKHYGTSHGGPHPGVPADAALGTVTARDHHSVVQVQLDLFGARGSAAAPAEARVADVQAFLVKYYGSSGRPESQQQSLFEPLHTATAKARFGLVVIEGTEYQIVDIGMRMLAEGELFAAQGFPAGYVLDAPFRHRRLNKTEAIELAGNSVCPPLSEALVRANLGRGAVRTEVA